MADLNALIAQGYQFQAPPDPFVQYGKMQQLENSATQNQLARQQMTEGATLAPYKLAETKAKSSAAQLELKQAQDAQDFVNGIMQKVAENHGGINDPMEAAQQMLLNPNPKVQMIGKNLAEAHQLVEGIKQQRAYAQRPTGSVALAAGPAAAPTAAYMPATTQGTLGGPTPAMPSSLGSGTFDVNAPAVSPTANALAPAAPAINALRPGAVTAESVADQIRQGNATFGNAPGWTKDREILMKQYEALLNPRQRTFASIDPSKYTQASIQAFNVSGDQSDLVPRAAEAGKVYAPIIPKDYTPESLKAYGLSGDVSDLIPVAAKADKPTSLISQIDPSKFTPASVAAFNTAGNYSLLVPVADKADKIESPFGKIDPDKFTPASLAKYAESKNFKDLVPAPKAPGAAATPAAPVAVVGSDGKVKYVSREEAISKGMTPASAMEGLAPKEIQNREAKYPVAKRATATVSATMTEIENTIDRLLANENGLNGITGFVGGRTFAVTDAARKAEADLKQLKNLAFVQGLTELRNASSTGAGVGNVSNKEGDRFENLKASLEQTQSLSDLIASLKRLRSQSTATRDTVNQAFEDTYAYRANAPAAAAKPSGGAPPPPPGFKPD